MVKNKKGKKSKVAVASVPGATASSIANRSSHQHHQQQPHPKDNLDDLVWLRECELRRDSNGEPYLQLEYQPDDELVRLLQEFLAESAATKQIVLDIYQIWQQTVLSTLLQCSGLWKRQTVTAVDQRQMKDHLKLSRYKINFIMHHAVGSMLCSVDAKWMARKDDLVELCHNTLTLLPRLAESCPHHKTDIRQTIIHFEGKEFLSATACETWDTLYDFSIPFNPTLFIPVLRRCAMLDILDKDWNMLGGWEDILKGLEAKCFPSQSVLRLHSDHILHEQTTVLRNSRNSMQCKFFSVRFMRYTEDQAPQRWRYFPKCSAPACAHIESPTHPHKYRCRKCWYFHYCSASCQEYSDNIMGLHGKFCADTPEKKAAQCRKETEQYLGWAVSATVGDDECSLQCRACGATQTVADWDASVTNVSNNASSSSSFKMKRCTQCRAVCYCSRQCQEWDWRVGGHKAICKPAGTIPAINTPPPSSN
jgi:hypothetical protein